MDRKVPLARLERDSLRNGPARERAVPLEPKVVVEPPGVVALHDEDRGPAAGLLLPERLRRLPTAALALVLPESGHEPRMPDQRLPCLARGGAEKMGLAL